MQIKPAASVALLFMLLLMGQAFTGHLNQIPGEERATELDSPTVVMSSNNTTDTDGDGIYDTNDDCPNGETNWTSSYSTDHDGDGCKDNSSEDMDDDNDGLVDAYDSCMVGNLGWISSNTTDYDSDGCQDSSEDLDDDNDGVLDANDSCMTGDLGWISSNTTDADSDGCRDATEDTDGGAGSGNSSTGCGNDASYTSLYAYSYSSYYYVNDTFTGVMSVYCGLVNMTMTLDYSILNASNSTVDSGNMSWIGSNSNYTNEIWNTTLTQSGTYGFYTVLGYYDANQTWTQLDTDYDTFTVWNQTNGGGNNGGNNTGGNNTGGNNTGGNNTGGNNTGGCGDDASYTSLYAYSSSSYYYVNDTFTGIMNINCGLVNMTMTLDYSILDASNSTVDSGNMSWVPSTSIYTYEFWNTTLTQAGTYGFYAVLGYYDANQTWTQLDTGYDTFSVLNQTNGGGNNGGNNTGGNNTTQLTYNAYLPQYCFSTAEDIEIFMTISGLNATEFYLEWEISSGSAMVASGSPLININSSGIVSYDWTFNTSVLSAGVYTIMLNPADSGLSNLFSNSPFYYNIEVDCNNTGGNNTGGNNTGGNNTGGNNTGGNNTGGNNTGGNTTMNDSHCLIIDYVMMNASGNEISMNLTNICPFPINYPAANLTVDHPVVSGLYYQTTWFYMIPANGSYNVPWQLSYGQNITNGTIITFTFNAWILNCENNNSFHQCPDSVQSISTYSFVYLTSNTGGNNTGGNNTGGNNTGGNNTGGNNTGGNNTGGNNTGGNNTGGNNTGGNNTGGNNTGGNNTGGNNTGGNNTGGNNTGGNNTGGNNTGGNNTGGNNTGGNNTGGNNTGGNNTGGNNTGGNNTGGNNTGGNNTGGNNTTDTDGDGIIDTLDNCPTTNNSDQSDLDQDGLGDVCDGDTDGDGLADADDAFPNDPTEQSDLDGDGVGDNTDADDDGDGVADANDNCPLIANSDQADLDGNGVGTACDGLEVTIDDNGTIAVDGDSLPALGMVGTAVAISAGFLISIRREDEE